MKKYIIFLFVLFCGIGSFAQFATFEPILQEIPNTNSGIRSTKNSQIIRTTGYILSESGQVKKKIQLQISISDNGIGGESSKIVRFYNIVEGYTAYWSTTSVSAYAINGQSAISDLQQVAYANFTYWAYWTEGQIWFNL